MTALGRLSCGLRWLLLAQLAVGLVTQPVLCCSQVAPAPEVVLVHIGRHWLAATAHADGYRHEPLLASFRPPIAG